MSQWRNGLLCLMSNSMWSGFSAYGKMGYDKHENDDSPLE
jgi:hypothetical protein